MFVKSNVPDNRVALWLAPYPNKPETEVFVYGGEVFEVADNDPGVVQAIADRRIVEADVPEGGKAKGRKQSPKQEPTTGTQTSDTGTSPDPNAPPVVTP